MDPINVDAATLRWRTVAGDPDAALLINHDYTILGHDTEAGTLDMLVRWQGDGGHCPVHRHTATTTVLVLDGEQHLWDVLPDGSRGAHRIRRKGDYALSLGDPHPHIERGGPEGGLVFFGCHTDTGSLYEIVDDALDVVHTVTIESLVADWKAHC